MDLCDKEKNNSFINTRNKAQIWAMGRDVQYYNTSALHGEGITEVFQLMTEEV